MSYFKYLSLILGAWMIVGGFWVILSMDWWKKKIGPLYPENRPAWVTLSGLAVLVLVLGTWYQFFRHMNTYAFIVSFIVSLSLLKILLLSFFYKKYREIVTGLFEEPLALRVLMLSSIAIGAALLTAGVIF